MIPMFYPGTTQNFVPVGPVQDPPWFRPLYGGNIPTGGGEPITVERGLGLPRLARYCSGVRARAVVVPAGGSWRGGGWHWPSLALNVYPVGQRGAAVTVTGPPGV